MGWLRAIALSNNPVFPTPPNVVEAPRAPNTIPTLPGTRLLNANTGLTAQPPGAAAFVQPDQNNQVGVVIPLPP